MPDASPVRFDMPLEEAMTTQRAVRRLKPDPVDDALVLRLIELALKAPTGSNAQNWEFVVVRDPDVKAKLARATGRPGSSTAGSGADARRRRPEDAHGCSTRCSGRPTTSRRSR